MEKWRKRKYFYFKKGHNRLYDDGISREGSTIKETVTWVGRGERRGGREPGEKKGDGRVERTGEKVEAQRHRRNGSGPKKKNMKYI